MNNNTYDIFQQHSLASAIVAEIKKFPSNWSLTPLRDKEPYRKGWQTESSLTTENLVSELLNGVTRFSAKLQRNYTIYPSGVGLRTGDKSDGLLAIDVDGEVAGEILDAIASKFNNTIPITVSFTSGKEGRKQLLFQVPDDYRESFKSFTKGVVKKINDIECPSDQQLEFRYNGMQSVLPPSAHPETGQYKWIYSYDNTEICVCPYWLCDFILQQWDTKKVNTSTHTTKQHATTNKVSDEKFDLRSGLSKQNQKYLVEGVGEGNRDTVCYRLACDLSAVAEYLDERNVFYAPSVEECLIQFATNCTPIFEDYEKCLESASKSNKKPAIGYDCLNKRIQESYGAINTKKTTESQLKYLEIEVSELLGSARNDAQIFMGIISLSQEYGLHTSILDIYAAKLAKLNDFNENVCLFASDMFEAQARSKDRLKMRDVLPEPLAVAIDTLAHSMGASPENFFTHLLPAWGSVIGGKADIVIKEGSGYIESPAIRAVNVAASGDLKTPILKAATNWIDTLEQDAYFEHEKAVKRHEEQLEEWEATPKKNRGKKPQLGTPIQYVVEDKTTEALYDILYLNQKRNKQGLLIKKDEFAGEFKSFDKYTRGGDDKEQDMSLFNCSMIRKNRKTNGYNILIKKPVVSKTGSMQWTAFAELLEKVGSDDDCGYMARYLYNGVPSYSKDLDLLSEFSGDVTELQAKQRFDAISLQLGRYLAFELKGDKKYKLSFDAAYAFQTWQHESVRVRNREPLSQFKYAIPKLQTYLGRVCLVLHLVESFFYEGDPYQEISIQTMMKAIQIINFYTNQYRHIVYKNNQITGDVLNIKELIDRKGQISLYGIINSSRKYHKLGKYKVLSICETLPKLGKIVEIPSRQKNSYKFGSIEKYPDLVKVDRDGKQANSVYEDSEIIAAMAGSKVSESKEIDTPLINSQDRVCQLLNNYLRLDNQNNVLTSDEIDLLLNELEEDNTEVSEVELSYEDIIAKPEYAKYWVMPPIEPESYEDYCIRKDLEDRQEKDAEATIQLFNQIAQRDSLPERDDVSSSDTNSSCTTEVQESIWDLPVKDYEPGNLSDRDYELIDRLKEIDAEYEQYERPFSEEELRVEYREKMLAVFNDDDIDININYSLSRDVEESLDSDEVYLVEWKYDYKLVNFPRFLEEID